jgi:hypothetical protein
MTTPQQFVDQAVAAVADLSLFFVGASKSKVAIELHQVRSNLEEHLSDVLGPDNAVAFASEFVRAVESRRREIESESTVSNRLH